MQRGAIARALVAEQALVLADEPTGNLDSETGAAVLGILKQLVREQGHTLVMVTHDPQSARHGSRLVKIRDGRVESDEKLA